MRKSRNLLGRRCILRRKIPAACAVILSAVPVPWFVPGSAKKVILRLSFGYPGRLMQLTQPRNGIQPSTCIYDTPKRYSSRDLLTSVRGQCIRITMSQNKEAGSFGGNFFKDFYFSQGDYRWEQKTLSVTF